MTDEAPELLPCPFCGPVARKPRLREGKGVKCGNCGAWGPAWEKPDGSEWNIRADLAPSPAPDVRKLVEAAKEMSRIWKRPYYGGGGTGERNNDISDAVKRIDAALATQEERDG